VLFPQRTLQGELLPTIIESIKDPWVPGHGHMCTARLSGPEYPSPASTSLLTNASPDFAGIDRYVTAQMQEAHIPGLAVGIVHLRGFGVADLAGHPVTPQTPFILGSLSKSFTAVAIMQLIDAGKMELDAPVQRYLPWFRVADSKPRPRYGSTICCIRPVACPLLQERRPWPAQGRPAWKTASYMN
jgi:CubicO group peptidase (beta-lactamase class C family)